MTVYFLGVIPNVLGPMILVGFYVYIHSKFESEFYYYSWQKCKQIY